MQKIISELFKKRARLKDKGWEGNARDIHTRTNLDDFVRTTALSLIISNLLEHAP